MVGWDTQGSIPHSNGPFAENNIHHGVLYIIYWGSGATGKPLSYIREIREELTIHFRTTIMYSNVYIMYTRYHPIPCPVQSSRLITGNYIFIQHTMSYFPLCAPSGAQQEESRNGLVSSAKAFSGTRPACGQSVEDKGKNGKREVDQGFFCCMCVVWHSRTGRLVSPDSLATCDSFVVSVSSGLFLFHSYEYR